MTYQIWGDYNLPSQNLLEEFNYLQEARDWFLGYTTFDLGGYEHIYIVDKQGKLYQAAYAEDY